MKLHERIKTRRVELKMSQSKLAEKTGYKSRSAISRIESGENHLTQKKIERFAYALQTTPAFLMGWEDKDKRNRLSKRISKTLRKITRLDRKASSLIKPFRDTVNISKEESIKTEQMIEEIVEILLSLNDEGREKAYQILLDMTSQDVNKIDD